MANPTGETLVNDFTTKLAVAITDPDATEITVTEDDSNAVPNFRIVFSNGELALVTGKSGAGNTVYTVTRGVEGTAKTTHSVDDDVEAVLTAQSLKNFFMAIDTNFLWDAATQKLDITGEAYVSSKFGVGTKTPAADVEIRKGSASVISMVTAVNATPVAAFVGRSSRGVVATPTASQSGDILARFGGYGYGADDWAATPRGAFEVIAAENWTNTAQGTYLSLKVTPTTSITPAEKVQISQSGVGLVGTSGNTIWSQMDYLNPGGFSGTGNVPRVTRFRASEAARGSAFEIMPNTIATGSHDISQSELRLWMTDYVGDTTNYAFWQFKAVRAGSGDAEGSETIKEWEIDFHKGGSTANAVFRINYEDSWIESIETDKTKRFYLQDKYIELYRASGQTKSTYPGVRFGIDGHGSTGSTYIGSVAFGSSANPLTVELSGTNDASTAALHVRSLLADTRTRFRISPNGSPTGITANIDLFAQDYTPGGANAAFLRFGFDTTLVGGAGGYFFGTGLIGTGINYPIIFASNGTEAFRIGTDAKTVFATDVTLAVLKLASATAAALAVTNGTNAYWTIDTRLTTSAVTAHTVAPGSGVAIASASGAYFRTLNIDPGTYTFTGTTNITGTGATAPVGTVLSRLILDGSGSLTISEASSVYIGGAVRASRTTGSGTQTITNSYGLYLGSSAVNGSGGAVTTATTLRVDTPSGATNNYAAMFNGGSVFMPGIGVTLPFSLANYPFSIAANGQALGVYVDTTGGTNTKTGRFIWDGGGVITGGGFVYQTLNDDGSFKANLMIVNGAGQLGLGVLNPTHTLHLGTDDAAKTTTNTWTVTSDERTKRILGRESRGVSFLKTLPAPVVFEHNGQFGTPDGARGIGWIAQQLRPVAPDWVIEEPGEDHLLRVNTFGLDMILFNSVLELDAEYQSLRDRVTRLEARVGISN